MSARILELVFRHKFLLSLPIILGLAGGVFALSRAAAPYYSSRAAIWVERPTLLNGESFTEFNPYNSPAQNQANSMRELLGLNSFAQDIVQRVGPSDVGQRMGELRTNTFIYPYGNHVLYLEYRSRNAVAAQRTVAAIVEAYTELYKTRLRDKAVRSEGFYEEQLAATRTALEEASGNLRAYLGRNPQLANVDISKPPSLALRDVEFARLVAAEQAARESYDHTLQKYAESQISANTIDGTIPNFLVMDEPQVPFAQITPGKRALVLPPAFGLASGMFLSAVGFLIYWRLDHRIHLAEDLAFLGAGVPLMTIPYVTSRRSAWPGTFVRIASALQNGLRPHELAKE
jgi:uncharacterized protein involved in exopolysaccharide biosynthesis